MRGRGAHGDSSGGWGRVGLALALAIGLAVVLSSAAAAQQRAKIAVLPVIVHSSEDPQYLREGLADMLASRIEQADVLQVIRVDDLSTATTSLEAAIETARGLGARFVLFGSFTRFGNGASLDMQCAATDPNPGREPLREIFVHSGSIGEVIPDLQDLVGKISRFAVIGIEEELGETPVAAPDEAEIERAGAEWGEVESETPARTGGGDPALNARVEALEAAVQLLEERLESMP